MVRDVIEKVDDLDVNYFRDRKPIIDRFRGYMKETDSYLKGILDFCRDFDDTLLLFISDHGTSTGERYGEKAYGIYCYDYSIKTYACFVNRELFPPVKVTQLTRTVDLFPTILDLFGFTPDPGFMKPVGESLLPLCRAVRIPVPLTLRPVACTALILRQNRRTLNAFARMSGRLFTTPPHEKRIL